MEFPSLLLVLLVLPVVAAGVILAVSVGRRRSRGPTAPTGEPLHRFQSGTAADQDAVVHPAPSAPPAASARLRRAASADRPHEG